MNEQETKLPAGVWVCGMWFRITGDGWKDDSWPVGSAGLCNIYQSVIHVCPHQGIESCRETLWHEILHAHDRAFNIGLSLESWLISETQKRRRYAMEEHTVLVLSRAMLCTMRDPRNAEVMAWLMGTGLTEGAQGTGAAGAPLEVAAQPDGGAR